MSLNLKKYGIDLIDKWNKFIEINEDNSWILYGFEGQTFTLIHWGSGNNGIEELSEELSDSSMMYGAVCLRDPSSLSHKIIFIIWQGQSVPGYIRHKVKTFDEDIKKFFKGYNCDITARSYSDLSNGLVEHKPISENKSEIKVESREMNSNKNIESCQEKQTSKDIHIQTQPKKEKSDQPPQFDNGFSSVSKMREFWMKESDVTILRSSLKGQTKSLEPSTLNFNKFSQIEDCPLPSFKNSQQKSSLFSNTLNSSTYFKSNNNAKVKSNQAPISGSYRYTQRDEPTSPKLNDFQSPKISGEVKSKHYENFEFNQNIENRNSLEMLKENRKKEINEMISKSKVTEMKNKLKSSNTLLFSNKNGHSKSDTKTSGDIILAKEEQNNNKINGSKWKSISEKTHNVQNLHQNRLCSQNAQTKSTTTISNPREHQFVDEANRYSRLPVGIRGKGLPHGNNITARVLYNYDAEEDNELSIKKNEILIIVEKDKDWWIAINSNGNRGNIPGNYVEIIDQAQQKVSKQQFKDDRGSDNSFSSKNNSYRINESKSTDYLIPMAPLRSYTSNEQNNHITTSPNKSKDTRKNNSIWSNAADSICNADNIKLNGATKVTCDKSDESVKKNCTRFPKYIATFSCEKEGENELSFEENDILLIIDANDSGWWVAKNMAGEEGLVPFNYLTKL